MTEHHTPAARLDLKDAEARTELLRQLRRDLVSDTAPSEALTAYVEHFARLSAAAARSRVTGVLHGYSALNRTLLRYQEAAFGENHRGLYAGSRQWELLGRQVSAAAVAKQVWAPAGMRTVVVEDPDTGEETRRRVGGHRFTIVDVYDYTDTFDPDGGPEPDWATPLAYAPEEIRDALVAVAPVPVRWVDLTGSGKHGHLTRREIVIARGLAPGSEVETLAHELGHHFAGHLDRIASEGEAARPGCEQEATLVSFLVLKALGLDEAVGNDLTVNTVEYLRNWDAAGHKARFAALSDRLDAAWAAAEQILDLVEAAHGTLTAAEAAVAAAPVPVAG